MYSTHHRYIYITNSAVTKFEEKTQCIHLARFLARFCVIQMALNLHLKGFTRGELEKLVCQRTYMYMYILCSSTSTCTMLTAPSFAVRSPYLATSTPYPNNTKQKSSQLLNGTPFGLQHDLDDTPRQLATKSNSREWWARAAKAAGTCKHSAV